VIGRPIPRHRPKKEDCCTGQVKGKQRRTIKSAKSIREEGGKGAKKKKKSDSKDDIKKRKRVGEKKEQSKPRRAVTPIT